MDVVIVRENEEDLYAGIEYQSTPEEMLALKVITRPGCEKIVRYAFEYARQYNRKKVTCFTKDNILKMTDGLFHKVFDEIGAEYPEMEKEHWIVDIGAAKMADTPEAFDVIVMPNLYGDVLSDVAAQIAGSVGLAGSSNIGEQCAMFEAIHGSAPRRAGQNMANPSGLLQGAHADAGAHRPDRCRRARPERLAPHHGRRRPHLRHFRRRPKQTKSRDKRICGGRGRPPGPEAANAESRALRRLSPRSKADHPRRPSDAEKRTGRRRRVHRMAVARMRPSSPRKSAQPAGDGLKLELIANRGVKVWPDGSPETFCTDTFRCRFMGTAVTPKQVVALLDRILGLGLEIAMTENLRNYDGDSRIHPRARPVTWTHPLVAVIMGSKSDWETMRHAAEALESFGVPHETKIVSAHRTPAADGRIRRRRAEERGLEVIIAGAGGAAHLPGMVAAQTVLPVLGVPVESHALKGMDSLLSIVQMPGGIPVGTLAIGKAGATNAALLAVAILANTRPDLREKLRGIPRREQTEKVLKDTLD